MTDESQPQREAFVAHQADWFLQMLVNMANKSSLEIGVTLNIGGGLVSGMLIGMDQYFEGFALDFGSGISDPEASRDIQDSFSRLGQPKPQDEDAFIYPPNYIHLKDAKFFHNAGNPIPANRGVWWRGRLTQIDGFSLGNLS